MPTLREALEAQKKFDAEYKRLEAERDKYAQEARDVYKDLPAAVRAWKTPRKHKDIQSFL